MIMSEDERRTQDEARRWRGMIHMVERGSIVTLSPGPDGVVIQERRSLRRGRILPPR